MITKKQVIALLIVLFTPLISFSVTNGEIADKALEYDGITFGTWQEGYSVPLFKTAILGELGGF